MSARQASGSRAVFVSPSELDGILPEVEALQIACAADLIRESAVALRLPTRACSMAQMLLQRFYTCASLRAHCMVWVAGAALLVSSKLCDSSRSIRHVANVVHDRLHVREGDARVVRWNGVDRRWPLDFYGAGGYDWKHELIVTERHLLKELGFRVEVELPHKFVLIFVNTLRDKSRAVGWTEGAEEFRRLLQGAWNCANDVMRLRICATEEVERVACGCIAMSAKRMRGVLPKGWEAAFGSCEENVERICAEIERGYEMGETSGQFVDYSLTEVFKRYHAKEETDGRIGKEMKGSRGEEGSTKRRLTEAGGIERRKKSRFAAKEE